MFVLKLSGKQKHFGITMINKYDLTIPSGIKHI